MSVTYITGGSFNSTNVITSSDLASANAGDLIIACGPYDGYMSPPAGGAAWNRTQYNWFGGAYPAVLHWKILNSSDLSGTNTFTSASYQPLTWAVYRGPVSAAIVAYSQNTGSTLPITNPAKHIRHVGFVHYTTDRDGTGGGTAPTDYSLRVGSATGVFTGQIADRLTGSPDTSHTVTWTGFDTTYDQLAVVFELRAADHIGNLASTDPADTASGSGSALVTATANYSDPADAIAAQGSVLVSGALAETDPIDTLSGTALALPLNSLVITDEPDIMAAQARAWVTGVLAQTDAPDALDGSGALTDTFWFGSLATTDGPDIIAAVGIAFATGRLASIQEPDIASITGLVRGWGDAGPNDETWTIQDANAETWTRQKLKRKTWTL